MALHLSDGRYGRLFVLRGGAGHRSGFRSRGAGGCRAECPWRKLATRHREEEMWRGIFEDAREREDVDDGAGEGNLLAMVLLK